MRTPTLDTLQPPHFHDAGAEVTYQKETQRVKTVFKDIISNHGCDQIEHEREQPECTHDCRNENRQKDEYSQWCYDQGESLPFRRSYDDAYDDREYTDDEESFKYHLVACPLSHLSVSCSKVSKRSSSDEYS